MKPPLTLLLLSVCVLSSCSVLLVTHVVTQSGDDSVIEGDTVNISCCWMKETIDVMKAIIIWLKNNKPVNETTLWNESVNSESNKCLTLTLSNITREDSGRYVCKLIVEIPFYKVYENGTVITVRDRDITKDATEDTFDGVSDDPQADVLTHIMRCLPVLALFITFIYLHRSWSRAQSHSPAGPRNKTTSDEQENERREEEHNVLSHS